jgi:hypothetical protein
MHLGIWEMETEFYIWETHRKQERVSNKDIKKFRNIKEWRISDRVDTGNARGIINFEKKAKYADKLTSICGKKNSS